MTTPRIITGRELTPNPAEPAGALIEYYRAFNGQNMELMELNWTDSQEASTSEPLGGHQVGWNNINRVYQQLFRLQSKSIAELQHFSIREVGESFLCVGREIVRIWINDSSFEVDVRCTRWFTRMFGRWRQFHYHGSIDDSHQLQEFRSILRAQGKPYEQAVDQIELRNGQVLFPSAK